MRDAQLGLIGSTFSFGDATWPQGLLRRLVLSRPTATADYAETQEAVATLLTALRIYAPIDVTWTCEPMPNEHHSTIYPTGALHGIRRLFAAPPS